MAQLREVFVMQADGRVTSLEAIEITCACSRDFLSAFVRSVRLAMLWIGQARCDDV
jgi:hypothetical protein